MNASKIKQYTKTIATVFALFISLATVFFTAPASAQAASSQDQFMEMADTLAIQKLLGQYMSFVDAGEFEDYSMLFAEDGELVFQSFNIKGRKDIFDLMSGSGQSDEPASTPRRVTLVHTMSNSLIELDGNTATHVARWINMSPDAEGQPVMRATGLYLDELRKINGEWKIGRRVVTNDIPYVETEFE